MASISPTIPASLTGFDVRRIRRDFPILHTHAHGKPLVYLDNGATTQKPQAVLDRLARYYESENANIHRGVYLLSQTATLAYEEARRTIAAFINAPEPAEVIFTRGTTEAINLVASSFGRANFKPGQQIIVSAMEHHSNIVPWQIIAQATGAMLRVIPMNDAGELLLDEYAKLLKQPTCFVSVVHASNSLGTINDVRTITRMAHDVGAKVLIDGAQWVAHHPTDVRQIDCDFYAFSGHKLYGPTGIGILWGRRELLDAMPPYQGGGDMIESVTFEKTTYAQLPNKFEAGTPHIAGAVGLAAAIEYVQSVGFQNLVPYEESLMNYATKQLRDVPGVRIIGTAKQKGCVLSFVIDDPPISSLDIGNRLDREGVAVRTGHHCCQPVMDRLGITSTARASLAMYNTKEDVDALVAAVKLTIQERSAKRHSAPAASPAISALKFPETVADSPTAAADELADELQTVSDALGGRDAINTYIEEMGEHLLPMPDALKNESTRVHGCMSVVHLFPRIRPGTVDVFEFLGTSDAFIVKGLIAVLQRIYSGQKASAVLDFDIENFFQRIGLDQFISSQRRNGLAGMIKRIRGSAGAMVPTASS